MKFAVLDFETTGTSSQHDEIIQIGIAVVDDTGTVSSVYQSLVKPSRAIPSFITTLTGIADADVADAPAIEDAIAEMVPLLHDAVLVAHNAGFDAAFLQAALDKSGYLPFSGRVLDTVELARLVFPFLPSYRLTAITHGLGIAHDRPHQADSDALATAEVLTACIGRLRALPTLTLERLCELTDGERSDLGWLLTSLRAERDTTWFEEPDGYQYYRQFAMRIADWTDDDEGREAQRLQAERMLSGMPFETYLDTVADRMKELFPGYEPREGQRIMYDEVHQALADDSHLLVEAGTGTGKSLGYLLPSLYYGLKENKKIVVTTHTIQLQEQLRQRDLPLLQDVLPVPFKAAVFKGRSNYMCLRKFEQQMQTPAFALSREEAVARGQLAVWLSETERGEAEELNLGSRSKEEWNAVASDADSCLNRQCPWFRKCFYHRARQDALKADLVITNHAMVFTDMRAEHRLLPAYDRLIVDEAHHMEEVASNHLGRRIGYGALPSALARLAKDARTGQLPSLISQLTGTAESASGTWAEKLEELLPRVQELRESWEQWTDRLFGLLASGAAADETGGLSYRLKPDALPRDWESIRVDGDNVVLRLSDLVRPLEKLLAEIRDRSEDIALQSLLTDMNGSVKELSGVRSDLQSFVSMSETECVYWIEGHTQYKSRSLWMYIVPADVSGLLKDGLFGQKESVVLTSATLTVDKSFQYVKEQLGLDEAEQQGRLRTAQLPSPFNYRQQALLLIPRDFPSIKGRDGEAAFLQALTASLAEVATETRGRMLVLFTSHKMLKTVYEPLKSALAPVDIQVLGQGMDGSSRSRLTSQFMEQPRSVLLGTSSFWEGVDLPGDALTCLAIVRLPFQPPNHPVTEAKSERLTAQRKNPFMKLSLPQAVIKFKQGFGRLVRTASDKGIVILYDTRVIDTSYGKYFLYSLPGPKMEHLPLAGLVPRVREWLHPAHAAGAEAAADAERPPSAAPAADASPTPDTEPAPVPDTEPMPDASGRPASGEAGQTASVPSGEAGAPAEPAPEKVKVKRTRAKKPKQETDAREGGVSS
ncbi:ATP-dependent DNA helicase DinG [Cohnella sp. OV330]|uniref:ATP-dependent DNA helicase DinG n=1 Tax=Cohnella sp. OV330 TaxID=1855288 RepID=UPI0008EF6AF6|nr:ATP-dependent DNA helicase DinG [Cohnella sp. OV330]SFB17627.1 ATP-dependent DNA helicase DinG [Cohnella sp. OV330]